MTVNLSDVFSSNITKHVEISFGEQVFTDGILKYDVVSEEPCDLEITGV